MTKQKTEILSLFEEATPYLNGNSDHMEGHGFEDGAGEDALDRLAEIGQKMAALPSVTETDRRCKVRVYRALAPERSAALDALTLDERLLLSIIDDLDPLAD